MLEAVKKRYSLQSAVGEADVQKNQVVVVVCLLAKGVWRVERVNIKAPLFQPTLQKNRLVAIILDDGDSVMVYDSHSRRGRFVRGGGIDSLVNGPLQSLERGFNLVTFYGSCYRFIQHVLQLALEDLCTFADGRKLERSSAARQLVGAPIHEQQCFLVPIDMLQMAPGSSQFLCAAWKVLSILLSELLILYSQVGAYHS
ncbi:hypothetical protein MARINON1_51678 [Marinobacter salarius]|nr:hypothetical protein MBHK15_111066 [Marinobacter salarius]VXB94284.1 hypothetical protein MARINON1_51678 [Marinobacter salarius]